MTREVPTTIVDVKDARTRPSRRLDRAEAGEGIVPARANRPAVRPMPVAPARPVRGHGSAPEAAPGADVILEPLPEPAWEGTARPDADVASDAP